MNYYSDTAGEIYLSEEDREWLINYGCAIIPRSDFVDNGIAELVNFPARNQSKIQYSLDRHILAPFSYNDSVIFPYDIYYHNEKKVNDASLQSEIEDYINKSFGNKITLLSPSPETYFCLETNRFSYEIIAHIALANADTPFAVFSSEFDQCFCWDFDLSYSFLSTKRSQGFCGSVFENKEVWDDLFSKSYLDSVPRRQRHKMLMETYILPEIGRHIKLVTV